MTSVLLADDELKQKVQLTKTEIVELPAGGIVRIQNSIGEVTVRGWDRPDVEVTTVRSSKDAYGSIEQEKITRQLNRVSIRTERQGNEVVVKTDYPGYRIFPPPAPWHGVLGSNVEYRINMPRDAALVVEHTAGEVHIDDLTGNIQVSALRGEITMRLPQEGRYAIDAKTDIGFIISDFPGHGRKTLWLLGHRNGQNAEAGTRRICVRMGVGDIAIMRTRKINYIE